MHQAGQQCVQRDVHRRQVERVANLNAAGQRVAGQRFETPRKPALKQQRTLAEAQCGRHQQHQRRRCDAHVQQQRRDAHVSASRTQPPRMRPAADDVAVTVSVAGHIVGRRCRRCEHCALVLAVQQGGNAMPLADNVVQLEQLVDLDAEHVHHAGELFQAAAVDNRQQVQHKHDGVQHDVEHLQGNALGYEVRQ